MECLKANGELLIKDNSKKTIQKIKDHKEAYYFSHDSNARHDPKIVKMLTKYQYGYQWYFMIIEILRDQKDFKYQIDSYSWKAIALELHEQPDVIESFVMDCIKEFELFKQHNNYFWSESLLNRMKLKTQKSKIYSKNAKKRWEKKEDISNATAMQLHNNGTALKEKKGKEKKTNTTFDLPVELEGKITKELWSEWGVYRNEIKKPLTYTSIKKQVEFLILQVNPSECINSAIRNRWQGLFEVPSTNQKPNESGNQITAVEFLGGDAFGEFAK